MDAVIPSTEIEEDKKPWYAIKLYSLKQRQVDEELRNRGFTTFVPMKYYDYEDENGHVKHALKPVVHNLLFVRRRESEKELRDVIRELPYKMSVVKRSPTSSKFYPIPYRQMMEFQTMCNPELGEKKFIGEQQAKLKKGQPVAVKYGPLKGLTGKLVRADKKYYLLKEVPGMGIMLKVTRWCCVPLEDSNTTSADNE